MIPYQATPAKVIYYIDNNVQPESHALLPLYFDLVVRYLPGCERITPELDVANGMPTLKLYQRQGQASTRERSAGTTSASSTVKVIMLHTV